MGLTILELAIFYNENIDGVNLFLACFSAEFNLKICYTQEEEQFRNSMMLDLLYVSRAHDLAPHILTYYQLYCQLPISVRPVGVIDTNARLVKLLTSGVT